MSVKRVDPAEAAALVDAGWTFVDVRSVPEFEDGHPSGAYNVPIMHKGPSGMAPNPRFLEVMKRQFRPDQELVVGCRSGQRSLRAATLLAEHGFESVVDMRGGFGGERAGAEVVCEGWQSRGLPVANTAEPGRSYAELED